MLLRTWLGVIGSFGHTRAISVTLGSLRHTRAISVTLGSFGHTRAISVTLGSLRHTRLSPSHSVLSVIPGLTGYLMF